MLSHRSVVKVARSCDAIILRSMQDLDLLTFNTKIAVFGIRALTSGSYSHVRELRRACAFDVYS